MIRKANLRDLEHRDLRSERTGEKYSLSAILTDDLGLKDMFVHHEIIPPGRRASGTHFHHRREEMVFVIEGKVTAWCNGEDVILEPGDLMGFPPGKEHAHHLKNEADISARVLVIASNLDDDDVGYL
jgi:uncharacterized cupin superfamily protein